MSEKKLLQKADFERIIGQSVSSFEITSGSNQGDNVGGSLLSIQVTLANKKENLNLIYKCLPPESKADKQEDSHYIVKDRIKSVFRIETCMYEKVFPLLKQTVEKRMKTKETLQLAVPKYISGYNDDFKNDYVCLEDLRPQGFKMQDKHESLTVGEVTLVMKEIAKFHALTHFLIRYQGEKMFEEDERFRLLKYNCLTEEDPVIGGMFSRMFKCYFENTAQLLRDKDEKLAQVVGKFVDRHNFDSFHTMRRLNHNRTDKTVFPCIIHGDLWLNNILFKYDYYDDGQDAESGFRDTPTKLKFIDFQLSRRSNVYEELGYFFWTSTTVEFRKSHLVNMLNVYYTLFENTLIQLDFPMPVGFTRGTFLDEFNGSVLSAYLYMPFALSLQMMGDVEALNGKEETCNKNGRDLILKASDKTEWMTEELWNVLEEDKILHKKRMQTSPEAMQRLEDLTREVVELKLL